MSSSALPAAVATPWRSPRRLIGTGRWLADRLFGFGFEGKVRLGGLSPQIRWLTVVGLTTTMGLLVLILHPSMVTFGSPQLTGAAGVTRGGAEQFVDATTGLVAVTLIALGIAWALLLTGVTQCAGGIRVAVALAFIALNGNTALNAYHYYSHGSLPPVQRAVAEVLLIAGFWVVPFSLIGSVPRPRSTFPLQRLLPALSSTTLFATMLWVSSTSEVTGSNFVLDSVDNTIGILAVGLLPLVFLSGFTLFRFAYGAGMSIAHGTRKARGRILLPVVWFLTAGGVAWLIAAHGNGVVRTLETPRTLIEVVPGVVGLAVLARLMRSPAREPKEVEQESVSLMASILIAIPLVGAIVILAVAPVLAAVPVLGSHAGSYLPPLRSAAVWWTMAFGAGHKPWGQIVLFSPVVASCAILVLGSRTPRRTQRMALGLLMLVGWYLLYCITIVAGVVPSTTDLLVVVALLTVLVYLVVRRKSVGGRELAAILGFLLIALLVDTNLGVFTTIGNWVGLKHNVIFVVGVGFTLLGRSQFTSGNSRRFPRPSRPLIWTGYLILALLVFLWGEEAPGFASVTFFADAELPILGAPFVAWLLLSGRFREPGTSPIGPHEIAGGQDRDSDVASRGATP